MSEVPTIRVLIADDHEVLRRGVEMLLRSTEDIVVAGQAGSYFELAEMVPRLAPDVVLLDLAMPGAPERMADKLALVRPAAVLVFTAETHRHVIEEALAAGAEGYLTKTSARAVLLDAIHRVAGGEKYCPPLPSGFPNE